MSLWKCGRCGFEQRRERQEPTIKFRGKYLCHGCVEVGLTEREMLLKEVEKARCTDLSYWGKTWGQKCSCKSLAIEINGRFVKEVKDI